MAHYVGSYELYSMNEETGVGRWEWWEQWLCGVERGRPLRATLHRIVCLNMAFAIVSGVAVLYTLATARIRWSDAEDAAESLLTVPTLVLLLRNALEQSASRELRCWVAMLTCVYGLGVAIDLVELVMGRWSKAAVRSFTALIDAGSLYMWAQILYLQRRMLADETGTRHRAELGE